MPLKNIFRNVRPDYSLAIGHCVSKFLSHFSSDFVADVQKLPEMRIISPALNIVAQFISISFSVPFCNNLRLRQSLWVDINCGPAGFCQFVYSRKRLCVNMLGDAQALALRNRKTRKLLEPGRS